MSADLDTIDGQIAFVSHRIDAWHRTGTIVDDLTLDNMLELGHLADWDVEKMPVFAQLPDGGLVPVTDRYANVRKLDNRYLGTVGTSYTNFQNESLLQMAKDAVEAGAIDLQMMQPETCGAIKGGRVVFLCFSLPRDCWTLDDDEHVPYFSLLNGFDGSTAVRGIATTVRTVCRNTVEAGIAAATASISFVHRSGVESRAAEMSKALGLAIEQVGEYQTFADQMMHTSFSDAEFQALLDGLIPPVGDDASAKAKTMHAKGTGIIRRIYETAPTVGKFQGTKWGAFQAVNEYEQWFRGSASQGSRERGERAISQVLKAMPMTVSAKSLLTV